MRPLHPNPARKIMSRFTSAATILERGAQIPNFSNPVKKNSGAGMSGVEVGHHPRPAGPAMFQVAMMVKGLLHALWPVLPPSAQICTM